MSENYKLVDFQCKGVVPKKCIFRVYDDSGYIDNYYIRLGDAKNALSKYFDEHYDEVCYINTYKFGSRDLFCHDVYFSIRYIDECRTVNQEEYAALFDESVKILNSSVPSYIRNNAKLVSIINDKTRQSKLDL